MTQDKIIVTTGLKFKHKFSGPDKTVYTIKKVDKIKNIVFVSWETTKEIIAGTTSYSITDAEQFFNVDKVWEVVV